MAKNLHNKEAALMDKIIDKKEQGLENPNPKDGTIVNEVNDVISDLLKNVIGEMQKSEMDKQLGAESQNTPDSGEKIAVQDEMDVSVLRQVADALQKFLDNANLMIAQLEGINNGYDPKGDSFIDGYIATADSILEVAAFGTKDTLTGLSNKYGFDNRLILEWNRAVRETTPLSLLIFRIDGAGSNSTEENQAILKAVAETLLCTIKRSTDFLARWSDNEFAALLPITDSEGAKIVAERILTELENAKISDGQISVHIGVGVHTPSQNERAPVTDFIKKTQNALRKAIESGHNSIVFG